MDDNKVPPLMEDFQTVCFFDDNSAWNRVYTHVSARDSGLFSKEFLDKMDTDNRRTDRWNWLKDFIHRWKIALYLADPYDE